MTETLISGLSNKQLFEVWEMTTNLDSAEVYTVRGWLMEEIEKRFPEAYEKWLLSESCLDEELKTYCLS